jgi:hemoglobin
MKARFVVVLAPLLLPAALIGLALSGCGKKKPPQSPEPPVVVVVADAGDAGEDAAPPKSLYERLGGGDAIKSIVEKLVENVTQDPAVSKAFKKTTGPKLDAFKKELVDQLCEVAGGPCAYKGADMKSAHKGMKITEAQFDAMINDTKLAMAELKIDEAEQTELIDKLLPMKDDIVEVHAKGKK